MADNSNSNSDDKKKTKFSLHLVRDGRHMFYDMWLEQKDTYYTADYRYGIFGSSGKKHFQFFSDDSAYAEPDPALRRTAYDKAVDFVTFKYHELWEKGYREEVTPEVTNSSRPISNVGETIYLEHKDMYCGDRSFYQYTLRKSGREYYVEELQGNIGERGMSGGFMCDTLEEALDEIAERVKDRKEHGYKKKPTPKTINCKIINPDESEDDSGFFDGSSNGSSGSSSDDDASGDSDDSGDSGGRGKRKRKAKKPAAKKSKAKRTTATTTNSKSTSATSNGTSSTNTTTTAPTTPPPAVVRDAAAYVTP